MYLFNFILISLSTLLSLNTQDTIVTEKIIDRALFCEELNFIITSFEKGIFDQVLDLEDTDSYWSKGKYPSKVSLSGFDDLGGMKKADNKYTFEAEYLMDDASRTHKEKFIELIHLIDSCTVLQREEIEDFGSEWDYISIEYKHPQQPELVLLCKYSGMYRTIELTVLN